MHKTIYFTSFPRTGTHTIGINFSKLYDATAQVYHDTDNFDNENVVSVLRDPLQNIVSYYVHHITIHSQPYSLIGLANAAKDYLAYYDEAKNFPGIVYADFNLLSKDFKLFSDKVADAFMLNKAASYEDAIINLAEDNYRGKPWKASVVGSEHYDAAVLDLTQKIGLKEQYDVYNELITKAIVK